MTDSLDQALSERFALQRDELPMPDFADVLRRATEITTPSEARKRLSTPRLPATLGVRRVLVAAVVVAALVGVGVAIAAGFGAFNGISAAQHPQTPADRLDPKLLAEINTANQGRGGPGRLLPDSARLVKRLPDARIYVVATANGQLCVLAERLLNNNGKSDAGAMGCGSPLTQSQPSTAATFARNQSSPAISWGVTIDAVTAVSFMADGHEVTEPVANNVWAYEGAPPTHGTITAHFKDGSTEPIG